MIPTTQGTMLPEPDLFSGVPSSNHNQGSKGANVPVTDESVESCALPIASGQGGEGITNLCDSDISELARHNIELKCHPNTGASVISRGHLTTSYSSASSIDQRERRVRRWYLIVIVLLYVGLITSFCLNVSLLLKSYPEQSSSEIRVSQQL